MGILEFISEILYEAGEESGFYELGYSEKCDNYYDMYNDAQNELSKAFRRILKDKLSTMTNGDLIKTLFPNVNMELRYWNDDKLRFIDTDWWNESYKTESEEV